MARRAGRSDATLRCKTRGVSRFYDRVMQHGCGMLSADDVMNLSIPDPRGVNAYRRTTQEYLEQRLGRTPTEAEISGTTRGDQSVTS